MIRFENVTKYYPTRQGRHYVLRDVSLLVPNGAQMGVLGRNGAGKTTLLRLMGGVDVPNAGRIIRTGNISWPLGLGAGIQSIMTGRENARFCCRIQGVPADEIADLVEHMRELAELGKFFDMPAKTYSSGMKARLKFAMAMSFDFDCYIIDELGAVGDASYRRKSKRLFREKRTRSSFIRVSHISAEIMEECNCGLVIENGEVTAFDTIEAAAEFYRELVGDEDEEPEVSGGAKWKRAAKEVLAATGTFEEALKADKRNRRAGGKAGKRKGKKAAMSVGAGTNPEGARKETRMQRRARRRAQAPAPLTVETTALGGPVRSSYRPAPMAPRR